MKTITAVVAAMLLTAGAASAHPVKAGSAGHSAAKTSSPVTVVLRGRFMSFLPARGQTDGSVTIRVMSSSLPGAVDYDSTLTVRVTSSTIVSAGVRLGGYGSVMLAFLNRPLTLAGSVAQRIDSTGVLYQPVPLH
jgi:hypothetical protein